MVTQIEPFVVGFDVEVLDVIGTGEAVVEVEGTIEMAPEEEGGGGLLALGFLLLVMVGIDEVERGEAVETGGPVLVGGMFLVEVHAAVEVSDHDEGGIG